MQFRLTVTQRVNGVTLLKRTEDFSTEADAIKAQCLVNAVAPNYDWLAIVARLYPSLNGYEFSVAETSLLIAVAEKYKISAIKYVREVSGASLKDSKDYVDALTA